MHAATSAALKSVPFGAAASTSSGIFLGYVETSHGPYAAPQRRLSAPMAPRNSATAAAMGAFARSRIAKRFLHGAHCASMLRCTA